MFQPNDPLFVQVFYQQGDPPFITAAQGPIVLWMFESLECGLVEYVDEGLFDNGDGDYTFSAYYDLGQYGPYGECEIAPHWELAMVRHVPSEIKQG